MASSIVRIELFIGLGAMTVMVLFQLLTGRINTAGLLRALPSGPISPLRTQMLLGTLIAAGWYLQLVMASKSVDTMPEPPAELLALLGGSHAAYLGGHAMSLLRSFQNTKQSG